MIADLPDLAAVGADVFENPLFQIRIGGFAEVDVDEPDLIAGSTHELHSAVAVALDGKIIFSDVSFAGMTMRRLDQTEIEAYLDQAGESVTTSVGAYQLEGLGVHLVERIEGDHFTILGLPLLPLLAFLRGERLLNV